MKEVTLENIGTRSVKKYYGVLQEVHNGYSPCKGFITRPDYRVGRYRAMAADAVTLGNAWTCFARTKYLRKFLKSIVGYSYSDGCRPFKVYQFDSPEKLFTWLVQD